MDNTTSNPQSISQPGNLPSQPVPSAVMAPVENKSPISIADYYDSQTWAVMKMMATTFIDSKAFPAAIQNTAQFMVRLQAGREIGLKPIESLKYLSLINGVISLWGDKAIEMVITAGHEVEWGKCDDKTATCKITRKDTKKSMEATFTMAQAIERKLNTKEPWVKSPENMLKFKAFHMIAKFIVPDALHGMGIAEIDETEIPPPTVINNVTVNNSPSMTAQQANIAVTPIVQTDEQKGSSLADRVKKREEEAKNYKEIQEVRKGRTTPKKEPDPESEEVRGIVEGEVVKQEIAEPIAKEAKEESDAVKKMRKVAKQAEEEQKMEIPDPKSHGAEFYNKRLIEEELGGRKLTKDEVQWISKYNSTNKG